MFIFNFLLLTGATYIHWGKSKCTSNGRLVYSGELVVLHLFLNVLISCTELRQINPFHDVNFCNSLLSGYPFYHLSRLQNVQSSAAKLFFRVRNGNRGHSLIQALCWLLVQARIDCQLSVTASSMPHLLPISLTFSLCTPLPDSLVPDSRHADTTYSTPY